MGPGATRKKITGKPPQNSSIPALIFWSSIPCVLCLYIYSCTLLNVVSYYDLNILSMSVMGFQEKLNREWMDGVSFIQFYFGF